MINGKWRMKIIKAYSESSLEQAVNDWLRKMDISELKFEYEEEQSFKIIIFYK